LGIGAFWNYQQKASSITGEGFYILIARILTF
jgi:hypothetical protein